MRWHEITHRELFQHHSNSQKRSRCTVDAYQGELSTRRSTAVCTLRGRRRRSGVVLLPPLPAHLAAHQARSVTQVPLTLSECCVTSPWWKQAQNSIAVASSYTIHKAMQRSLEVTIDRKPSKERTLYLHAERIEPAREGMEGSSAKRINQCVRYALLFVAPGRSVRRAISRSAAATRVSGRRCR